MGIQIKQSKTIGATNKADIVFCIDNSGSMSHCIAGVRETVSIFVSSLEVGVEGQSPVDWRIGLVSYTAAEFRFMDLVKDTTVFQKELGVEMKRGDENTPGAIDFAISNTNWREGAQRVIVVFTDETLRGGVGGAHKFNDLLKKIVDSHIQVIYYGPECNYYKRFVQCPRSEVNLVTDFSGISFDKLMGRLAVTVSSGSAFAGKDPVDRKMVYDLSSVQIRK